MKLRIALIISHPVQHFCPQYASFARHGAIELKVFFASALGYKKYSDPNFKEEISWNNLRLDQFDHSFLNGETALPSNQQLDAPSLNCELDAYKPNLVVIYGYFQKLQRRAYRWATSQHVRIAYISDSERRHKRNSVKEAIKYFYIRNYFSKINYFLSVGDANEEFYKHYGVKSEQLIRMHFPIDVTQYAASYAQRESLRKKVRSNFQISDNDIVLTVVGKLVSWKNQNHLIDALKLLEGKDLVFHLLIIGSGPMKERWTKNASNALMKNKVHFTGFVSIEELPSYYAATDIYVHPAAIEPHSIAVSEAIYMGCPVIVSDRCGSYGDTDDVQVGKNGMVFQFGNIQELAEKINELAHDSDKRKRFGFTSHRLAKDFQRQSHELVLDLLTEKLKEEHG